MDSYQNKPYIYVAAAQIYCTVPCFITRLPQGQNSVDVLVLI